MIPKFLSTPKFLSRKKPEASAAPIVKDDYADAALRIIHIGGIVESYYMAVPADTIMKKYPSFLLGRPDIFRRPWDSLIHPDQILKPGERYFLVPQRTVSKLQGRIAQATDMVHEHVSTVSSASLQPSSKAPPAMNRNEVHKDNCLPCTVPNSGHSRRSRKKKSCKAVSWNPK